MIHLLICKFISSVPHVLQSHSSSQHLFLWTLGHLVCCSVLSGYGQHVLHSYLHFCSAIGSCIYLKLSLFFSSSFYYGCLVQFSNWKLFKGRLINLFLLHDPQFVKTLFVLDKQSFPCPSEPCTTDRVTRAVRHTAWVNKWDNNASSYSF